MTDPNPYPKVDYGRNINSPDVLIIGAGISGINAKSEPRCDCSLPVRAEMCMLMRMDRVMHRHRHDQERPRSEFRYCREGHPSWRDVER